MKSIAPNRVSDNALNESVTYATLLCKFLDCYAAFCIRTANRVRVFKCQLVGLSQAPVFLRCYCLEVIWINARRCFAAMVDIISIWYRAVFAFVHKAVSFIPPFPQALFPISLAIAPTLPYPTRRIKASIFYRIERGKLDGSSVPVKTANWLPLDIVLRPYGLDSEWSFPTTSTPAEAVRYVGTIFPPLPILARFIRDGPLMVENIPFVFTFYPPAGAVGSWINSGFCTASTLTVSVRYSVSHLLDLLCRSVESPEIASLAGGNFVAHIIPQKRLGFLMPGGGPWQA